jgi:hypothetical protein
MSGTIAEDLNSFVEEHPIVENSLVKILAYEQYQLDGKARIHVTEMSFVGAHPGHAFGNPTETSGPVVLNSVGITEEGTAGDRSNKSPDDGLQKLYSCYYPMDQQAKDTKIPRIGWLVEDTGTYPAPTCTWIPATGKQFGDSSTCCLSVSLSPDSSPSK